MQSPLDAFDRRNLLTYVSLLCGMIAVAGAVDGSAPIAGMAIAAAVVADTFDGRFARLFNSSLERREIGIQLDSLADVVAFGVAPVLCAILLADPHGLLPRAMLWSSAFVYVASGMTRLAFFNVRTVAGPSAEFIGVPVPVAALIWSSTLLAHPASLVTALVILTSAAGMVAPLRISRPRGFGLAVFTCWPLAVVIGHLLTVSS